MRRNTVFWFMKPMQNAGKWRRQHTRNWPFAGEQERQCVRRQWGTLWRDSPVFLVPSYNIDALEYINHVV